METSCELPALEEMASQAAVNATDTKAGVREIYFCKPGQELIRSNDGCDIVGNIYLDHLLSIHGARVSHVDSYIEIIRGANGWRREP